MPPPVLQASQTLRYSRPMRGEFSNRHSTPSDIDMPVSPNTTLPESTISAAINNLAEDDKEIDVEDAGVRDVNPNHHAELSNITSSPSRNTNIDPYRRLSFMEDVVYTSEDHAQERYITSYMNPLFSKAIQRPWIPTYFAEMFSIAMKGKEDVNDTHYLHMSILVLKVLLNLKNCRI